ncbi:DUF748 domain-containing protein [Catenovulum sp. SM1970]|uniref:DUF748 domain-containing protein n=1 Tax=Marinifaba aquimaris TaxID=2741323 RepID=UPI00157336A7|nr:DUF748 domain-containing protein [Marinifaba aquimaris]NTS75772.1 DUF748 domain-containing protein [Marinifaba aquimaris]
MKLSTLFFRVTAVVIVIFILLFASATWLVKSAVNHVLTEKEIQFHIEHFSFNPLALSATLEGVNMSKKGQTSVAFDQAKLNVSLIELFQGDIHIQHAAIDGLLINGQLIDDTFVIKGLNDHDIDIKVDGEQNNVAPIEPSNQTQQRKISLDEFVLTNSQFKLTTPDKTQVAKVKKLAVSQAQLQGNKIAFAFELDADLNQLPIAFSGSINQSDDVLSGQLSKGLLSFNAHDYQYWLPEAYKTTKGLINLTLDASFKRDVNGLSIQSEQMVLSLLDIDLPLDMVTPTTRLSLAELDLVLTKTEIQHAADNATPNINSQFTLAVKQFLLQELSQQAVLARFDTSELTNGALSFDQHISLTADSLNYQNLTLMQLAQLASIELDQDENIQPFAEFNQLSFVNIVYNPEGIQLSEVIADTKQMTFYRGKQNTIENWLNLSAPANESTPPAQPKVEKEKARQKNMIKVDKFAFAGKPVMTLLDYSTEPEVVQALNIETFELTKVSNQPIDSMAEFIIKADVGKRSSIAIDGSVAPFYDNRDMQVTGHIKGMNLTPYSPYVAQSLGYDIEKGLLFADFDFKVEDQIINGQVSTNIKAIALSESQDLSGEDKEAGVVPLNLAINQLTNDQGNLEVDIPLSGNVNDPNFGLSGFISLITTKALTEGAKNYIVQTFVPYANVVSLAMLASDTLFEVSLNDLEYQIGQADLAQSQIEYADELGRLMNEKKQFQLSICPSVLFDKSQGEVSKKLKKQLNSLGEQRVDNFIDYLIEQYQIDDARLIPCKTKLRDSEKATAKLAFEIK